MKHAEKKDNNIQVRTENSNSKIKEEMYDKSIK